MKWMYNGQLYEENELKIPANDHGFLYGVGLFETFRVYDGVPFLFNEHLARIQNGLPLIGINYQIEQKVFKEELQILLNANNLENAYVRLTITAGTAPLGLPTEMYQNPSVLWQIKNLGPLEDELPIKNAYILKQKQNLPETNIRLKSLNFLNNVLAKQEITTLKNTEGFFLNTDGFLAEGIVSNIFFVREGQIYTPSIETGILNGITRQYVIKLSKENNFTVNEGFYHIEDIFTADEVFITNSIQEIVRIVSVNDKIFSTNNSSLTSFLASLYKQSIKEAIRNKGSESIEA